MGNWTSKRHVDTRSSLVITTNNEEMTTRRDALLKFLAEGGRLEITRDTPDGKQYKLISATDLNK